MNQTMEQTILRNLYLHHFGLGEVRSLAQMRETEGWTEEQSRTVAHRLTERGLIRAWTMGENYRITSEGILYAEDQGWVEAESQPNKTIRNRTLEALAHLYEEKGIYQTLYRTQLAQQFGVEETFLQYNLTVLEDVGYVAVQGAGAYRITHDGMDAVQEWRSRLALIDRFEQIAEMDPHPRGRAFQTLIAQVAERDGWEQEEGVRTSNEELDVVIFQGREYYLVECKWEREPAESEVVSKLFGRLSKRVGIQGIIVSMSGFTSGTMLEVTELASQRMIFLFGPIDVRQMIEGRETFNDLLNTKYRELIMRKKVLVQ